MDFEEAKDAESCHKLCGRSGDCEWWTWEPKHGLCVALKNCTESGHPDAALCQNCISGQKE